jgi:hypothetical protein
MLAKTKTPAALATRAAPGRDQLGGEIGSVNSQTKPANQGLRSRCRSTRCRCKLEAPTDNPRRAFCCRTCFEVHYRTRCVVCESPIRRKREDQRTCVDYRCKRELRRFPEAYGWPEKPGGTHPTSAVKSASETLDSCGSKPASKQIAGPPLSPRSLELATVGAAPAKSAAEAVATVPVDLLGARYRWPGAGHLDRDLTAKVLRSEVAEPPVGGAA